MLTSVGVTPFIKTDKSLTYKSIFPRELYKSLSHLKTPRRFLSLKKFPEYKMFGKWIHKRVGGHLKSRPDKRCKNYHSQAKKNGAAKRKKK
jgi:hypothetical protein